MVATTAPVPLELSNARDTLQAFYLGLSLAVVAIVTKLFSGVGAKVQKVVVGSAMVGRGEFAYLVAETAR